MHGANHHVITQHQADGKLAQVLDFYDLGEFAKGVKSQGLTGRRRIEILAEIAENGTPNECIRAIQQLDRILDRNVEASGLHQTGHATRELGDGTKISVTLSAIGEVGKVGDMFKAGLAKDEMALYSKDLSTKEKMQSEKDAVVVNRGESNESQDCEEGEGGKKSEEESKDERGFEGESEERSDAEGHGGKRGGEAPDLADGQEPGGTKSLFCESDGSEVEGTPKRHLGHFPPCVFVPGGGATGVPEGADPYSYGQDRCVSIEEARRLAQCSLNEGIDGSSVTGGPAQLTDEEIRHEKVIESASKEERGGRAGRPVIARKVGAITMFDLV